MRTTSRTASRILLAAFLPAAMALASCGGENGRGDAASPGRVSLTFTVEGIAEAIAEDGGEASTRALPAPETVVRDLGDGLSLVYTLAADPVSATRSTTAMAAGTKYRLIVYKASDDSYVDEDVFTAGTQGSFDGLPVVAGGYKLAAYSFNTAADPGAVGPSAASVTVDPSNDLLHWVGSVPGTAGNHSAAITFKRRFTRLAVRASSELTGDNMILFPGSAVLTPAYKGEQVLLADADPGKGGTGSLQTFIFPTYPYAATVEGAAARCVFTSTDNPVTLTFNGTLVVNAASDEKSLVDPIVTFNSAFQPGRSYTLTMRVEASKGNYYEPFTGSAYEATIPLGSASVYSYTDKGGVARTRGSLTFLRYNLGADPQLTPKQQMAYPHTDDKNIRVYGGLYQWGRKDVGHSLRDPKTAANENTYFTTTQISAAYNPSTDTKFVYGNNSSWTSAEPALSNLWGNGTSTGMTGLQNNFQHNSGIDFSGNSGVAANQKNPCPTGYRVPTQYEWALIMHEGGSVTVDNNDYFEFASGGSHLSSSGAAWYVPLSNTNVVWVRVSDKKAATGFAASKMNGYALYNATDAAIDTETDRNTVFAVGTDLTAAAAPTPLLFLPATGYRRGNIVGAAAVTNTGSLGYYWSSCGSYYVYLSNVAAIVYGTTIRIHGFPIRCVKNLSGGTSDY